jgi:hypothetical protein
MGDEKERRVAIIDSLSKNKVILDFEDKNALSKWGQISGISTIGVFGAIFIPFGLMVAKNISREQKLKYLRIGFGIQLLVSTVFIFSSYKLSNIISSFDK